jgi:ATPase subunit of ABC transporter with duplicated ATPase domains
VKEQIRRLKQRALRVENETTDFHFQKQATRVARQAKVVERRLERFQTSEQRVERPERQSRLRPELAAAARSGDRVLSVDGLCLQAGDRTILRDVGFELFYGDRVALLGPNGSGKTAWCEWAPASGRGCWNKVRRTLTHR